MAADFFQKIVGGVRRLVGGGSWSERVVPIGIYRFLASCWLFLGAATHPFASPPASIFQMKNRSKGRSLLMKMNSGPKRRHLLFDEASE
jgi:hypothetical protein